MKSNTSPKRTVNPIGQENIEVPFHLILFNDDFNLYEYVIDSLVEVCDHHRFQAEQCTLIAHHKGKCDVKSGPFNELKNMKDELSRRGLSSTIIP
jgi:ATP-dependent Clp protease adaptor protein ClpS